MPIGRPYSSRNGAVGEREIGLLEVAEAEHRQQQILRPGGLAGLDDPIYHRRHRQARDGKDTGDRSRPIAPVHLHACAATIVGCHRSTMKAIVVSLCIVNHPARSPLNGTALGQVLLWSGGGPCT
jgi:hypothetical protein